MAMSVVAVGAALPRAVIMAKLIELPMMLPLMSIVPMSLTARMASSSTVFTPTIWPAMSEPPKVIPHGYTVQVDIPLTHQNAYPDPDRFDPDRFLDASPDMYSWVPFGGGTRRCLGAAFANMEMNVVLRTLLRQFRFVPTSARPERMHSRGVAFAPKDGGRAVVYRRIRTSAIVGAGGRQVEVSHQVSAGPYA